MSLSSLWTVTLSKTCYILCFDFRHPLVHIIVFLEIWVKVIVVYLQRSHSKKYAAESAMM